MENLPTKYFHFFPRNSLWIKVSDFFCHCTVHYYLGSSQQHTYTDHKIFNRRIAAISSILTWLPLAKIIKRSSIQVVGGQVFVIQKLKTRASSTVFKWPNGMQNIFLTKQKLVWYEKGPEYSSSTTAFLRRLYFVAYCHKSVALATIIN